MQLKRIFSPVLKKQNIDNPGNYNAKKNLHYYISRKSFHLVNFCKYTNGIYKLWKKSDNLFKVYKNKNF